MAARKCMSCGHAEICGYVACGGHDYARLACCVKCAPVNPDDECDLWCEGDPWAKVRKEIDDAGKRNQRNR